MSLFDPLLETRTLATLLRDPSAFADLPAGVSPDLFEDLRSRRIFAACLEIGLSGDAPNAISVRALLEAQARAANPKDNGTLSDDLDQQLRAADEAGRAMTDSEFAAALGLLLEMRKRRRLRDLGRKLSLRAEDVTQALSDVEGEHERGLLAIDAASGPDSVSGKQVAREYDAHLRAAIDGTASAGLRTGIDALDTVLKINSTDLVLLGGRPAAGKSVLALQIARLVAEQGPVLFVGLEMHRSELHRRLMRAEGGLRREDVVSAPNLDAYEKLATINNRLSKLPLEYADNSDLDSILRTAIRLRRKRGLKLLIVDYVQRIRLPEFRQTRDQSLGEAASRLKDFAARFEVPVLALAALSRESSRRDDPRPRLEDLRESGRLEYEANSVVFVHVPSRVAGTPENLMLKNPTATYAEKREAQEYAELIVQKQRDAEDHVLIRARAEFTHTRFAFPEPESTWEQHQRRFGGHA